MQQLDYNAGGIENGRSRKQTATVLDTIAAMFASLPIMGFSLSDSFGLILIVGGVLLSVPGSICALISVVMYRQRSFVAYLPLLGNIVWIALGALFFVGGGIC